MKAIKAFALFIARTLLASIFIYSALDQMMHWDAHAQLMTSKGMTLVPLWLLVAIFLELFGGLALVFGYHARIGALALILLLIASTAIFENFWMVSDPEREPLLLAFIRNMSLAGGLLYVMTIGPGIFSLDYCKACRRAKLNQAPPSAPVNPQPPLSRE